MGDQFDSDYNAYLQKLAEGNITDGVLYEPRAFFDYIRLTEPFIPVKGHPEVFKNGEEFPIVLTHMTASMAAVGEDDGQIELQDERYIQRVGMYMNFHDQYYMSPPQSFSLNFGGAQTSVQYAAPLPTWVNTNVATSGVNNQNTVSWTFPKPFILSTRDSMRVEFFTPYDIGGRVCTVAFSGVGAISRQPYNISGSALLDDNATSTVPTNELQNDGVEPIVVKSMSASLSPDPGNVNGGADTRFVFMRVKQIGNGTNGDWFQGPLGVSLQGTSGAELPGSMIGVSNLGVTTGRSVVHTFPKPVILSLDAGPTPLNSGVQVALSGYIAVQ